MIPHLELPSGLTKLILKEARHLPSDSLDEFLSLILVECVDQASRMHLGEQEVGRIVWRVRKRMSRKLLCEERSRSSAIEAMRYRSETHAQPEHTVSYYDELRQLLSLLTVREATILELLLEGRSQSEIAAMTGLGEATVSRDCSTIREKTRHVHDRDATKD
jgi:DNA-binding CsgD family transcriptional regulator